MYEKCPSSSQMNRFFFAFYHDFVKFFYTNVFLNLFHTLNRTDPEYYHSNSGSNISMRQSRPWPRASELSE